MLSEPMSRPASLRPLRLSVKKNRIAGSVRRKAPAKRLLFERESILLFSWASTAGSFLLLLFFGGTKKSKSLCKAPGYSLRQGLRFNAGPTLAILLFLTAAACNKEDDTSPADQLPPITMEGKGTFACLINGEVWKWKGRNPWNGFPNLDVLYDTLTKRLFIQATKEIIDSGQRDLQVMTISNIIESTGTSFMDYRKTIYIDYTQVNEKCIDYELDSLSTKSINILKLDKISKIISGTFEFTAINECDTLRITEGRFDDFYRE